MILAETVLPKLADWQAPGEGRHLLTVPDEGSGWAVALTIDRQETVGCQVWDLTVRRSADTGTNRGAELQAWADRVAQRVTGLLETLKVVEVDVQRNEALLRSTAPSHRGDTVSYYEVLLKGTAEAVARRYQASIEGKIRRQQVPFALTHEALAKLASDLTAE
jgi:hypothetical protein